MDNSFFKVLKGDRVVWMMFIFIFFVSIVEMFSASSYLVSSSGSISGPILRHVMFFVVGFIGLVLTMMVPFKYIRILGYFGLIVSWILLLYTLAFGVEQAGAARFLRIGGVQFQPSELGKISLLIVIADFVYRYDIVKQKSMIYTIFALVVTVTCGLIFPENFSTAAILFTVCIIMMFIGCVKFKYLFTHVGIVAGLVLLIVIISALIPEEMYGSSDSSFVTFFERSHTWVARIENFFIGGDPESKYIITDENYQVAHAQIAVARGGLFGELPGNSLQRNFLPEAYSDFIFAIIVEELGFIGGVIVIGLYLTLLFRAGVIAKKSKSLFTAVLVIGVTLMIVFQAFIHMGVAVNLGPVTGQPLPLISRGGTSIVINCIYFGLILSVANQITLENKMLASGALADTEQNVIKPIIPEKDEDMGQARNKEDEIIIEEE